MPLQLSDEWKSQIEEILSTPGVTVVVGDVDTGKSSFCVLLANAALARDIPTGVVDCDIGQSEIGPPGTIGMGLVESGIETLNQVKPKSLYFVGATNPYGHLVASVTGAKKMCEKALELESSLVIVDTSGFVRGSAARKLKTHKIDLLNARHIVALQRAGESEHFLRVFDAREYCAVHRLSVSPLARSKPSLLRAQRRAVRFREYFENAQVKEFRLDTLATSGTWLRTGTPLDDRYLKFAERELKAPIVHGERIDRGLYLVVRGVYNKHGVEKLEEQFRTKNVVVTSSGTYLNLLVGLLGGRFELLAIGIVQGLDFRSQTISILTPLRSLAPVKVIRFGDLKLRPGGSEIGKPRPGELQ